MPIPCAHLSIMRWLSSLAPCTLLTDAVVLCKKPNRSSSLGCIFGTWTTTRIVSDLLPAASALKLLLLLHNLVYKGVNTC